MNKRGISVVISSILLILLVVSLFSVIGYFLKRNPEKAMEKGSETFEEMMNCNDINLEIEKICYSKYYNFRVSSILEEQTNENIKDLLGITIKNNNNFELNEFRLKFSFGDTRIIAPHPESIKGYNVKTIYIGLTSEEGEKLKWVKLYPIINGKTCNLKEFKLNIEGVEEC